MRDLILTLFVFALVPVALFRPYVGLLLWAWFSYMNPHRLTWGFAYNFRFNLIVAGITILGILFTKRLAGFKFPIRTPIILLIIFIIWTYITSQFAFQHEAALIKFDRFTKTLLMIFATLMLVKTRRQFLLLVIVITLSVGFYGIKGGIFTLYTGGHFRVMGPSESFFVDNNSFALAILMTIPLLYFLMIQSRNYYIKIALLGSVLFSIVSVVGSYSRGGFIGLSGLSITLFLKTRRKILILLIFATIGPIVFQFMPDHWHQRMAMVVESLKKTVDSSILPISNLTDPAIQPIELKQGFDTFSKSDISPSKQSTMEFFKVFLLGDANMAMDRSVQGRFDAWKFSIAVANARPLIGGGFNTFDQGVYDRFTPGVQRRAPHSIYFEVLAEHGYVGLILWTFMHITSLMSGRKIMLLAKRDPEELNWAKELAGMLQVSLIGYYIAGIFLGMAYFDLPYHIIALIVLLQVHVERHLTIRHKLGVSRSSGWSLVQLATAATNARR
ncbi:MAG: putative O-glycosylation ligase, exosortase A system-associated [Magnetococcus sp. YQC-9]